MAGPEQLDTVVLVADDDALVRSVLRMALSTRDISVIEAADARETRAALHAHHFDLVVLDINMPGGTVHDTLAALRRERPDLPVLVLSGDLAAPDDLRDSACEFARKPIELDDFLARVAGMLAPPRTGPAT